MFEQLHTEYTKSGRCLHILVDTSLNPADKRPCTGIVSRLNFIRNKSDHIYNQYLFNNKDLLCSAYTLEPGSIDSTLGQEFKKQRHTEMLIT